jgi:starch phosphorylase
MKELGPIYNTHRMVQEYARKFYFPAFEKRLQLMKNNWEKGKQFSAWKSKVYDNWSRVKFLNVKEENKNGDLKVGSKYSIFAEVELGDLTPNDVDVQIYYGKVENGDDSAKGFVNMTDVTKKTKSNKPTYRGEIECKDTGLFGFTLRVLPKHELLINQFELGLIRWA